MAEQPIKVFYSELSGKFFASNRYRIEMHPDGRAVFTITGKKYDVTQDVARAVVEHELEFTPVKEEKE